MDVIGGMGDPKAVGAMIDPIIQKAVGTLQTTLENVVSAATASLPEAIKDGLDGMTITVSPITVTFAKKA